MRVIALTRDGRAKAQSGFHMDGVGDREGVLPEKHYSMAERISVEEFLGASDVVVNSKLSGVSFAGVGSSAGGSG
jgi:hypothetical protein